MLLLLNAGMQGLVRIIIQHRYRGLAKDRAAIKHLIHQMNRATGDLGAMRQCIPYSVGAGKGRQQSRMDIDDAATEALHKSG